MRSSAYVNSKANSERNFYETSIKNTLQRILYFIVKMSNVLHYCFTISYVFYKINIILTYTEFITEVIQRTDA